MHEARDVDQRLGGVALVADLAKAGKGPFKHFPSFLRFAQLNEDQAHVIKSGGFCFAIPDFACDSEFIFEFAHCTGIIATVDQHLSGHLERAG